MFRISGDSAKKFLQIYIHSLLNMNVIDPSIQTSIAWRKIKASIINENNFKFILYCIKRKYLLKYEHLLDSISYNDKNGVRPIFKSDTLLQRVDGAFSI